MKHLLAAALALLLALPPCAARDRRLADGAWYGVNYTVPFAHANRAVKALGLDPKAVIDEDVSHFKRLGLNAFRLHLWDVELTDSVGNLLDNDHLDTLDYLLAAAARNGLDIILTAQTNFGNGYPERNTDPYGAFSYRYPKDSVHLAPSAQAAQERYLQALARHVNPYSGKAWKDDDAILAIEINNEPTHTGTPAQITAYIDRMTRALRRAGWSKSVLYNVSHNLDRTRGYYEAADIDGVTYQWYPAGLVAGHTRSGNFLPALDQYDWRATIPADATPAERRRWESLPRIFYEFDPADNLLTYLYPAVARTMRREGFTWLTQFAYDPTPIANVNTEYQTHYLNLLYTPGKAVGMMIAGEVMRGLDRGADYGKYPADTVFGPFTVSARRNLAVMNDGENFLYTNSNAEQPVAPERLRRVAGVGSSAVVEYDGTGAYFLDRGPDGRWSVEVMPDVVYLADPFATASPGREVARLQSNERTMRLRLPGLDTVMTVRPALKPLWLAGARDDVRVASVEAREGRVHAVVAGRPDSVTVYPATVNFWSDRNPVAAMRRDGPMEWSAPLEPGMESAWVVAWKDGQPVTWPGNGPLEPLHWTFDRRQTPPGHLSDAAAPALPLTLMEAGRDTDIELSTVPGTWRRVAFDLRRDHAGAADYARVRSAAPEVERLILTRPVAGDIARARTAAAQASRLRARLGAVEGVDRLLVSVTNGDGFTYGAFVEPAPDVAVSLDSLSLQPTQLVPEPFPAFLDRQFVPDPATATPLRPDDILSAVIVAWPRKGEEALIELQSLSLE